MAALGRSPRDEVRIADSAGLNAATLTFPTGECKGKGLPLRYTGLGTDEWCVKVEGLAPGSDSSNTITTPTPISLKLSVGVRHNFWFLPFFVVVGSILVGLVVTWLTTDSLPSVVGKKLVDAEVDANEGRPDGDDKKVAGLKEWVTKQRRGTSNKTLLPLVKALVAYGPTEAREARQRLQLAISASPLAPEHPIRSAAGEEAAKTQHAMTDFYSDGAKKERHPADDQILALNRAKNASAQLSRARATINALTPEQRAGLPTLRDEATSLFNAAGDEAALGLAEEGVKDLWRKIHDRIAELTPGDAELLEGAVVAATEAGLAGVPPDLRAGLSSLSSVVLSRFPSLLEAGAATLITIVLLAAAAAFSAASGTYIPKETFGSRSDYLGLFLAGLGSTGVAGILAALLLWQREKKS